MSSPEHSQSPDRDAFCRGALACKERLWGFALRLTRDRAEAEDLLQATYVRAFESWTQLRDLDAVSGWMLRTMHRSFVDACRRASRNSVDPVDVTELSPVCTRSSPHERTSARDAVTKALGQLAPPLAHALTLRDVWGFTYDEIAELMDCPIGTVRSRIARGRAQMLEILEENADVLSAAETAQARSSS